jgi:flavin reductase (DIM6/NTAB) family NADH-FMN oxidoreductase RutF
MKTPVNPASSIPSAPSAAAGAFDPVAYRRALGGFGTGVALVAAYDATGRAHGLVVNSLTSVSLHPPILLWCLAEASSVFHVFTNCAAFSVNILRAGEESRARQYSRRGDRILPPEEVIEMLSGAPVLANAAASLDCHMREHRQVGDHQVIFGDVAAFRSDPSVDALGYFRGQFVTLKAGDTE